MNDTDRHELADQVAILLQRAYPNELTKEELNEASGLPAKELRAVLDSLSVDGELDPLAENYRWRDPSGQGAPPPDSPEDAPPASAPTDPSDQTTRLILEVSATFAPAPDADDEQTMNAADKIAEQVQNVLGMAMPDLGATVGIRRLEVFDRPRVLYDAEEATQSQQES